MNDLANLGLVDDGNIVLDEAALTLALLDHKATDLAPYEDVLSDIALRLPSLFAFSNARDHMGPAGRAARRRSGR